LAWAGTPRATPGQVAAATLPVEEYLKDITKNRNLIEALVLKRGGPDADVAVAALLKAREGRQDALTGAVAAYLLGRARHWKGVREFVAKRDPAVFSALRPEVIGAYLSAFSELLQLDQADAEVRAVTREVVGSFGDVLSSGMWGASLSDETKQRVIREFVDVLEANPETLDMLPRTRLTAQMYANLGIQHRTRNRLPTPLPTEYAALTRLLQDLSPCIPAKDMMPVVKALETGHQERLRRDASALAQVARVQEGADMLREAFAAMKQAADCSSDYWLPLALMALRHPGMSPVAPADCLARHLSAAREAAKPLQWPADAEVIERAYETAIVSLVQASHHAEGLRFIDGFLQHRTYSRSVQAKMRGMYCSVSR
jgi:hypothetical protein